MRRPSCRVQVLSRETSVREHRRQPTDVAVGRSGRTRPLRRPRWSRRWPAPGVRPRTRRIAAQLGGARAPPHRHVSRDRPRPGRLRPDPSHEPVRVGDRQPTAAAPVPVGGGRRTGDPGRQLDGWADHDTAGTRTPRNGGGRGADRSGTSSSGTSAPRSLGRDHVRAVRRSAPRTSRAAGPTPQQQSRGGRDGTAAPVLRRRQQSARRSGRAAHRPGALAPLVRRGR